MSVMKRHDEAAERIIKNEGLAFALASKVGKEGDLREARGLLKTAIIKALESEWDRGSSASLSGDF